MKIIQVFNHYIIPLYGDKFCQLIYVTKLEYIYVVLIVKKAMWFHQLFNIFGFLQSKVLWHQCDNQSCIALILNIQFHDYTEHIEIQCHFLWKKVENKELELFYCSTKDMWANVFTKVLLKPKHDICCHAIGFRHSI
jgi:hypothetical protein